MKEVRRIKWVAFLIVMCMLFTMTPGMAFAVDLTDQFDGIQTDEQKTEEQTSEGEGDLDSQEDPPGTPPGDDPPDTPPGDDPPGDTDTQNDVVSGDGIDLPGIAPLSNDNMQLQSMCVKYGTLKIKKEIINGYPGLHDTFTFNIYKGTWTYIGWPWHWDWVFDSEPLQTISVDVVIEGDQTAGKGDSGPIILETGTYKIVEELDSDNYSSADIDEVVEIKHNMTEKVTFTNNYEGETTGSLTIVKEVISEDGYPEPAVFEFTVECLEDDCTEGAYTLYVTGGACVTLNDLEPGLYQISETEKDDFYPISTGGALQTAAVPSGDSVTVTFVNEYDPGEEPFLKVVKEVAAYNGGDPTELSYGMSIPLAELNKKVIFRIRVDFADGDDSNVVQVLSKKSLSLSDSYNRNGTIEDITDQLTYWDDEEFVLPGGFDPGKFYYYIDTLPSNGTYTNTVTVLGDEEEELASSSAVVTVDYSPGGGNKKGGRGGSGSTRYFEVTYDANYPPGADPSSGSVPTDNNNYTYNTKVSVRGNTGGLTAGNYIFEGWNTKADGTGTMYPPGSSFNIKEDTVLYAQWKLAEGPAAPTAEPDDTSSVITAELDDVPKTGSEAPIIPMLLLGLFSLAIITFGRKRLWNGE